MPEPSLRGRASPRRPARQGSWGGWGCDSGASPREQAGQPQAEDVLGRCQGGRAGRGRDCSR
eukprot:10040132-Alexandrium_andersonii.AAC.1